MGSKGRGGGGGSCCVVFCISSVPLDGRNEVRLLETLIVCLEACVDVLAGSLPLPAVDCSPADDSRRGESLPLNAANVHLSQVVLISLANDCNCCVIDRLILLLPPESDGSRDGDR